MQLAPHEAMAAQEVLLAHATNWVQQHSARHVPHVSVAMDAHWALIEPQVVVVPVPVLVGPLYTQVPAEHMRPVLHVPFPKHGQFELPLQFEPLPHPALRAKAVPNINTRNLSTSAVPLIFNSPFSWLQRS